MKEEERRKLITSKWGENRLCPISLIAMDLKMARSSFDFIINNFSKIMTVTKIPGSGRKKGLSYPSLHHKIVKNIKAKRSASHTDLAKSHTMS